MSQPLKLLIAEDNPADAEMLLRALRRAGFEPDWRRVDTEREYLEQLNGGLDLVLSDYEMPQFSGLRALELLKTSGLEVPLIIVSGTIGEDTAVAAMKLGAADYLLKDRLARVGQAVSQALEQSRLRRETRQIHEALKSSEERLRIVTDNARVGLVMVDRDRRYIFANAAYAEILGLASSAIVGLRVADVMAPLYETQIRPRLDRAFDGERVVYELRRSAPDGVRHYTVKYEPTKAEGLVAQVVVVITDITNRKRAEEELRLFRELVDESTDAFEVIDPVTGRFLDVSQRDCADLGYTREEMLALNVADIDPSLTAEKWAQSAEKTRLAGSRGGEGVHRRKDGTTFPIEFSAKWVRLDRDYVVAVVRDITGRKEADRRIREQLAELLRWQEVMLDREDRMLTLKAEVNGLLANQGQPPRYADPSTP
jgi:PAS domain S-box-containing protein